MDANTSLELILLVRHTLERARELAPESYDGFVHDHLHDIVPDGPPCPDWPAALRWAAEAFQRDGRAHPLGGGFRGGSIAGASVYNVHAFAARKLRELADDVEAGRALPLDERQDQHEVEEQ